MTALIYIPTAVDDKVLKEVQKSACEKWGGFTVVSGTGGWTSPSGEVITEPVRVVRVVGADSHWAAAMARYVRDNSEESAVLWETVDGESGMK